MNKFDIAVLGGGPGGYPAAIRAAQLGKKVALIEAKELGGTCLNRGCIPSKALIAGAEFKSRLKHAAAFGINLKENSYDFKTLASHKDAVVKKMKSGLEKLIAANQITVFQGRGQLISKNELKIIGKDNLIIQAEKIIIATGSEPRTISAFPFDYNHIHDSTSLLNLTELPSKIIIVGGGVIGCEFASLYAHLGVDVTILELLPRLLATESEIISDTLKQAFIKRGIRVELNAQVQMIEKTATGVKAILNDNKSIEANCCLVAVGRSLNTKEIGLDKAAVQVLDNGMISVNKHMETTTAGIYAVGDITSKWWLAHVATHQGLVAAENACGKKEEMKYNAIANVIFTDPEIGSVGLSVEDAIKMGFKAKTAPFPFQALGKSQAMLETDGFAQIVYDEKTGEILGAQAIGFEASTLIAEIVLAITNELTIECISQTIHAHPTISEVWAESAMLAEGFPLSLPPARKNQPR